MLKITLDREANALYVRIRDGQVARSVASDNGVVIDEDAAGEVIGVEILHISRGGDTCDPSSITLGITDSNTAKR